MATMAIAVVGGLAASPASADQGANVGAGDVTASVTLQNLPKLLGNCTTPSNPMTFQFSGSGDGVVFNDNGTQYIGYVPINGSGSNGAACFERELFGTINVTAFSFYEPPPINASVSCSFTPGQYTRLGSHVLITVPGSCTINAWASGPILFVAQGEFVPTSGDGINSPVTAASFAGAFTIAP
jgi:hypothetical protein